MNQFCKVYLIHNLFGVSTVILNNCL